MLNRVLLIDDSPTIHKIVELTMNRQLFELVGARTPEEGLQMALDQSPSIILIDSKLAEYAPTYMDQLYSVTGAGIILLVSSSEHPNAEYLGQMHAVSCLTKPFNASALNNALDSALRSISAEDSSPAFDLSDEPLPLVSSSTPAAAEDPLMNTLEDSIANEIMEASATEEQGTQPETQPEPAAAASAPVLVPEEPSKPELYVEQEEAPTDETPWDEILPSGGLTYAQNVPDSELIPSPDYKYNWLFADDETKAKMQSQQPFSPEERKAELLEVLTNELKDFENDFNGNGDRTLVLTDEHAPEAAVSEKKDMPGVVIQEQESMDVNAEDADGELSVDYQNERELLSDLYSLLGEDQDIISEEHMNVLDDAGDLEDVTSVLRQEIEERHEMMGMFDEMNQKIEELATRLEDASSNKQNTHEEPIGDNRVPDKLRHVADLVDATREEGKGAGSRVGSLTIDLSEEDLARILERIISKRVLEELLKNAIQASLEKVVPELTERVREELRLTGEK